MASWKRATTRPNRFPDPERLVFDLAAGPAISHTEESKCPSFSCFVLR